eukprot:scaffold310244_cov46-Prasinocladus_malaysianus.AAC.2
MGYSSGLFQARPPYQYSDRDDSGHLIQCILLSAVSNAKAKFLHALKPVPMSLMIASRIPMKATCRFQRNTLLIMRTKYRRRKDHCCSTCADQKELIMY